MTKNWQGSYDGVISSGYNFPHSALHLTAQMLQQFSGFPSALHATPGVARPHWHPENSWKQYPFHNAGQTKGDLYLILVTKEQGVIELTQLSENSNMINM